MCDRAKISKSGGMTLVELMVSIAVTMVVMTMVISFFVNQYQSYFKGKEIKKIQTTNLDGAELLRREISGAGWAVTPAMAFYILDGGANSDTIWVSDSSVINPNSLDTTSGLGAMLLNPCAGGEQVTSPGTITTNVPAASVPAANVFPDPTQYNYYIIGDSTNGPNTNGPFVSQINAVNPITLTSSINVTGSTCVAPAIQYYVDSTTNQLMRWDRNSAGAQAVANNVVDMQVDYTDTSGYSYGLAGCAGSGNGANGFCFMNPFVPTTIAMVHVTLVTRSDDQLMGGALSASTQYCRPPAGNRTGDAGGSASCGYLYRSYEIWAQPKNTQATLQ